MLRQIARLTRPVWAAGPRARAIAVYGDEGDHPIVARDAGVEGVACVDDAARALILFTRLWRATADTAFRERAIELLDFLLYMQRPDGRFTNFIFDWSGAHNGDGPTSRPDGLFWNARALHALTVSRALGDPRTEQALANALCAVPSAHAAADIRALHVLAALELARGGDQGVLPLLERWCDEIAAARDGAVIRDNPYDRAPHLWAHAQERALAASGAILGRRDLVGVARESAERLFVPAIRDAFPFPTVRPDDVASAIGAMDALFVATADDRYATLARDARSWFAGRNAAGVPVYDRERGRVADGIDGGRVSRRSGAESNIVAALALLDDVSRRWSAA